MTAIDARARAPTERARRWAGWAVRCAIGYLVLVVVGHALLLGLFAASHVIRGTDAHGSLPGVTHFRETDGRVWFGGQPGPAEYRELGRRGVVLVVDLRSGAVDDRNSDDPALLRRLGIDYLRVPVPDGHAPSSSDTAQVLRAVDAAPGVVYVHCGAGVGRSSDVEAAYLASRGGDPSLFGFTAMGPLTLEQLWYVVSAEPGDVDRAPLLVRGLSRAVDAPRRALSLLRAWVG
jgi:protein tyrosine phosphatase (PTP) superfamily phosphohydrolase (DUF442 family)